MVIDQVPQQQDLFHRTEGLGSGHVGIPLQVAELGDDGGEDCFGVNVFDVESCGGVDHGPSPVADRCDGSSVPRQGVRCKGQLDEFCLWTTCFGLEILSVECGRGSGFRLSCCRCGWEACSLAGSRGPAPGAPCTSTNGKRGARPSGRGGARPSGGGRLDRREYASAAPMCRSGWCSGGVCTFGSRSSRATVDVVGRLVVSRGLEARRLGRRAPRTIEEKALGHRGGRVARPSGSAGYLNPTPPTETRPPAVPSPPT